MEMPFLDSMSSMRVTELLHPSYHQLGFVQVLNGGVKRRHNVDDVSSKTDVRRHFCFSVDVGQVLEEQLRFWFGFEEPVCGIVEV